MRTICTYSYHGLFLAVVDSEPFTRSFPGLYSKASLSESLQIRPLHMLPGIDDYHTSASRKMPETHHTQERKYLTPLFIGGRGMENKRLVFSLSSERIRR